MKKRIQHIRLVALAGFLITLIACKKDDVKFIGPGVVYPPDGFNIESFSVSSENVNFESDSVVFNAFFSSSVSWVLTLSGKKSKAQYQMFGLSNKIDNLVWHGQHSGVFFFRTDEEVSAVLSFFGTNQQATKSLTITQAANFKKCGVFPLGGDFENDSQIAQPNWARFNSLNAEQGTASNIIDFAGNVVPPVQGNQYYYVRGLGAQTVFVDGIQFVGRGLSRVLPADANEVWVNIYVYGNGDANARLDMEMQEADADGTSIGYSGTDDDAFVATMILDHVGWKLFSFRYSDLVASANLDFGGSGNKIFEPNELRSFVLVLLKINDPDSPVEAYFDYPIFTVGGPFVPCT